MRKSELERDLVSGSIRSHQQGVWNIRFDFSHPGDWLRKIKLTHLSLDRLDSCVQAAAHTYTEPPFNLPAFPCCPWTGTEMALGEIAEDSHFVKL
jgi:hypothetical protein